MADGMKEPEKVESSRKQSPTSSYTPKPKITREELEERIVTTARLLARRLYLPDIRRTLMSRYKIGHAAVARYIAKARGLLFSYAGTSREEMRCVSLAFWADIVRYDESLSNRMRAQERLERLLGLEAPIEIRAETRPLKSLDDESLLRMLEDGVCDDPALERMSDAELDQIVNFVAGVPGEDLLMGDPDAGEKNSDGTFKNLKKRRRQGRPGKRKRNVGMPEEE